MKTIEAWLERAKSGELRTLACVGVLTGRRMADCVTAFECGTEVFSVAGGLNYLATKILLHADVASQG